MREPATTASWSGTACVSPVAGRVCRHAITASLVRTGTRFQTGHTLSAFLREVPTNPAARVAAVTMRVSSAIAVASVSRAAIPERFAVRRMCAVSLQPAPQVTSAVVESVARTVCTANTSHVENHGQGMSE